MHETQLKPVGIGLGQTESVDRNASTLVLWYAGTLVRWYAWYAGTLERWYAWYAGTLVSKQLGD